MYEGLEAQIRCKCSPSQTVPVPIVLVVGQSNGIVLVVGQWNGRERMTFSPASTALNGCPNTRKAAPIQEKLHVCMKSPLRLKTKYGQPLSGHAQACVVVTDSNQLLVFGILISSTQESWI